MKITKKQLQEIILEMVEEDHSKRKYFSMPTIMNVYSSQIDEVLMDLAASGWSDDVDDMAVNDAETKILDILSRSLRDAFELGLEIGVAKQHRANKLINNPTPGSNKGRKPS